MASHGAVVPRQESGSYSVFVLPGVCAVFHIARILHVVRRECEITLAENHLMHFFQCTQVAASFREILRQ